MKASAPRGLVTITARELDEEDCGVGGAYLIEDILPATQFGVISARKKCLKTHFVVDMCLSLATGSPFLGRFNVPSPVRAGVISNETLRPKLREMSRRIAAAKGFQLRDVDNYVQTVSRVRLPESAADVRRFVVDNGLQFLAIDPALKVLSGFADDATSILKMYKALEPLNDIVNETGCSIALVNHNRMTGDRFAKPSLDDIAFAGFGEDARWWLVAGRRNDWNPVTGEHWLNMLAGGSNGHGGEYEVDVREGHQAKPFGRSEWSVKVRSSADEESPDFANAVKLPGSEAPDKLEAELKKIPDGGYESITTLRLKAGIEHAVAKRLLTTTFAAKVETKEIKKGGQRCEGYRLKPEYRTAA